MKLNPDGTSQHLRDMVYAQRRGSNTQWMAAEVTYEIIDPYYRPDRDVVNAILDETELSVLEALKR